MLKTLRITSLIAMLAAASGVVIILIIGLKGNPEIRALLESPDVIDAIRTKINAEDTKQDTLSPLVIQAQKFALRIDPPPPPPPPKKVKQPPKELARREPIKQVAPPPPPVKIASKFDLLATVVYETAPEKSLALLKTGNLQEWFRVGEKAGHLDIQEIRDGSVVFSQGGKNPQEQFVPKKTHPKSLLKDEKKSSAPPPARVAAEPVEPGAETITPSVVSGKAGTETAQKTQTKTTPPEVAETQSSQVRTIDRTPRSRPDVAERIRRVRSMPTPPPPKDEKASIEKTMSGIEAIMSRQDESVSEEGRQREQEMWKRLLKTLNEEKQRLEGAAEDDAPEQNADRPARSESGDPNRKK